ncbi:type I polyketide synthase, partial [Streptomyces sp. NPDC048106]|uniref:type I polyketide synthase n=1 Tax=Streptomyces sp. NPDC048106 TaxID=3155750 RepID=UPI003453EC0E
TTLHHTGHHTYIETSTHPVLTQAIQDTLNTPDTTTETTQITVIPTLRRNQPEPTTFHHALATLHTHTHHTPNHHLPHPHHHTNLPTYPFQHQHYWLKSESATGTDIGAVGLGRSGHPLLGAVVRLPESDGAVFTNRVALNTHPWLGEHTVAGTVLVPGTALLELAVRAGDELGEPVVSELVVEAPLAVPRSGGVQLRVTVGERDGAGLRPVSVHSRTEDALDDAPWTRHVTGFLGGARPVPAEVAVAWPPTGAERVEADGFYAAQRAAGFEFGPLFQGLRQVWLAGDEVCAEVALPEDAAHTEDFLLHPALLDAALHAAAFLPGRSGPDAPARLPFAWSGVALHATGATALRVRVRPCGPDDIAVELADTTGAPVASIGTLTMRPADLERLPGRSATGEMLFRTRWTDLPVTASPATEPAVPGLLDLTADEAEPGAEQAAALPKRARALVARALEGIQEHLAQPVPDRPLVLVTRDARRDPAMAAVWGLGRVAQSENPGQVVLADVDDAPRSRRLLAAAVATGEPQLAVHDGTVTVPRLVRDVPAGAPRPLDPAGTVLVTGGTGTLGGLVARRLVTHHGARHLLLTSRRGPDAPGARELAAELTALGAEVTVTACDIGDPADAAALVAGVAAEHPLTAVVHSAAVLDDGVLTSLDPSRVETVFGPKVDGAWNLHLLTEHLDLAAFVLFSSASGTLGNAGQGNYAAGNGFLDGLAAYRRERGLPGLSLAWGLWEQASEMTGALLAGAQGHLKQDVLAMTDEEGLALFDAALGAAESAAVLVPVKLNPAALRQAAHLPAVLRGLVPTARPAARQAAAEPAQSLVDRLRALPPQERSGKLLDTVLAHTAATLGHAGAGALDARQAFRDLGFDSLAAVDLRNRVGASTGLRLPATLVFDYPTPAALAGHLLAELGLDTAEESAAEHAVGELRRFMETLGELVVATEDRARVAERLRELAAEWHSPAAGPEPGADGPTSDDDILRMAEAALGLPGSTPQA